VIVSPGIVVMPRNVKFSLRDLVLKEAAERILSAALAAWIHRWEDRLPAWNTWQVFMLEGPWGAWEHAHFLTLKDWGYDPAPEITELWSYNDKFKVVDPVPLTSRPILRDFMSLLTVDDWPPPPAGVRGVKTPGEVLGVRERLISARRALDATGCWADPLAGSRVGLEAFLLRHGQRLACRYDVTEVMPAVVEEKPVAGSAEEVELLRGWVRTQAGGGPDQSLLGARPVSV
jgi:hypothetical protein